MDMVATTFVILSVVLLAAVIALAVMLRRARSAADNALQALQATQQALQDARKKALLARWDATGESADGGPRADAGALPAPTAATHAAPTAFAEAGELTVPAARRDVASPDDTVPNLNPGRAVAPPPPAPPPAPPVPDPPRPAPKKSLIDMYAAEEPAPEPESDKTVLMDTLTRGPKETLDPDAGKPYLTVVEGVNEGKLYYLPFDRTTLGRDARNTLPLDDEAASKLHCEITYNKNRFVLRDDDSTNGTLLNGEPVKVHSLEFGDTIQVADTKLQFSCAGFDLKDINPGAAIIAFEACLKYEPNFLNALKLVAFLLERDVVRRAEADPYWKRIMTLEKK